MDLWIYAVPGQWPGQFPNLSGVLVFGVCRASGLAPNDKGSACESEHKFLLTGISVIRVRTKRHRSSPGFVEHSEMLQTMLSSPQLDIKPFPNPMSQQIHKHDTLEHAHTPNIATIFPFKSTIVSNTDNMSLSRISFSVFSS